MQNNVSIYDGVTLEEGFCRPSCVCTNVHNPRAEVDRKNEFRKTVVRIGASIGANATIVCGHDLGKYCFIAAGATVTKEVPAYALIAGTPARRIGWMSSRRALGDDLVCPETGAKFRQVSENQIEEVASGEYSAPVQFIVLRPNKVIRKEIVLQLRLFSHGQYIMGPKSTNLSRI